MASLAGALLLSLPVPAQTDAPQRKKMPRIEVAAGGGAFALAGSGAPFVPWGFNYDHDREGRLLEDYWVARWKEVEEDFREMKALGANVVRIHLQLGRFLRAPREPDAGALERLARLLALAESTGLYLDLTGLGCYHAQDVPPWYDALEEGDRWRAQASFWEAVAKRCAPSPAVFCYDLMNEPVVPGGNARRESWLGPAFAGKHFVQFIARERGARPRPEIARQWIRLLATAIRGADPGRLVTVGLVPWSLDRPGLTSGFVPQAIAKELDFLAVHLYPERGEVDAALETLRGFAAGKPVVIEETFPLRCSSEEWARFLRESRSTARGWIGFYWGKTIAECRAGGTVSDALMLEHLRVFREIEELRQPG